MMATWCHAVSVIVRLEGGGHEAWGEATPFFAPTYSPESAISVYETVNQFLLPTVLGEEIDLAAELLDLMSIYKGNPFAKAAVETAKKTKPDAAGGNAEDEETTPDAAGGNAEEK